MEYSKLVDLIKLKVCILSIIEEHVSLIKTGSYYKGLCPFHAEKTPSFSVNSVQGFFYCFGCKKGGDVIKFLMEIEKLGYESALKILAKRVNIDYDELKYSKKDKKNTKDQEMISKIYYLNFKLINTFKFFLLKTKAVFDYVLDKRGVSENILNLFELGYLPAKIKNNLTLYEFLISKGYSDEILTKSGLFVKNNKSILSCRLIFPIKDIKGNVLGFGGRILKGDGPKYVNLGEREIFKKKELLYGFYEGLSFIKSSKSVILTEGYIDVLAFFSSGIKTAVATLGTAFSKEHLALIRRYASEIIFCFDSDDAGLLATFKAYQVCLSLDIEVSIIPMNDGLDPADIYKSFGENALKELINKKQDVFDYLLDRYSNKLDLSKSTQIKEMASLFFSLVNLVSDDIKKEILLRKLGNKIGIRLETLQQDYHKLKSSFIINNNKRDINIYDIDFNYERYLIVILLKDFSYFNIIRRNITDEDLENVDIKKIFICFEEFFDNNEDFSLLDLKKKLIDKYKVSEVFFESMLKQDLLVDSYSEMIMQILLSIKQRDINKRIFSLKSKFKDLGPENSKIQINELMFLNMQRRNLRVYLNEKR